MCRIARRWSVGSASLLVLVLLFVSLPGLAETEVELPDLTGRWIMVQDLSTYAVLPIVNEIYITTTIALFSDVTQEEDAVTLQDTYCFTDIAVSTDLLITEIPEAAMRSLRPDPRHALLVSEGDTIRLVQQWHTEVRGAELEDPVNDPLPISPSDPRLVDQDGDGKIGMTVPVSLIGMLPGETYVTQRFRYRLEGDVVDQNTIIGLVEWTTEQTIVSATDALFYMPYQQITDPEPKNHRFVMLRVDETWDCGTAREELAALLDFLPPLPQRETQDPAPEEPATP